MRVTGDADGRQGLLDLTVNLSSPQIFSGEDFALYLHVKNPFDRPVWIHRVVTNLPATVRQKVADTARPSNEKEGDKGKPSTDRSSAIDAVMSLIETRRAELKDLEDSENRTDNDVVRIHRLRRQIDELQDRLIFTASKGAFDTISVRDASTLNVSARNRPMHVTLWDASTVNFDGSDNESYVALRGSLPEGSALMPGCEDAMTITLSTARNPFFLPATYRLNLVVHYSFEPEATAEVFSNTVQFTVAIRAAMHSVMLGSVIGAVGGAVGRLLQQSSGNLSSLDWRSAWMPIILAAILSMAAAVFSARKSETQSFVTVEDFWGGALVGFLIGYSGTAAFQNLTRIPAPGPA